VDHQRRILVWRCGNAGFASATRSTVLRTPLPSYHGRHSGRSAASTSQARDAQRQSDSRRLAPPWAGVPGRRRDCHGSPHQIIPCVRNEACGKAYAGGFCRLVVPKQADPTTHSRPAPLPSMYACMYVCTYIHTSTAGRAWACRPRSRWLSRAVRRRRPWAEAVGQVSGSTPARYVRQFDSATFPAGQKPARPPLRMATLPSSVFPFPPGPWGVGGFASPGSPGRLGLARPPHSDG